MQLSKIIVFANITVIFALLVSACGGSKAESTNTNTNANSAPSIVDTTTTAAIVKDVPTYFEATGNLASDASTDVAPTVGGKVVQVNFDIGSYVNKGDVLIKLDDRDARIRLEQTEAQYEQAKSQVNTAQANVDQAIASLRQAQVRLGLKDGETFNIKDFSQVKTITAQLELAEKELARATRLLETGDISRSIYDQRKSQRDALIGQLDEARSNAAVAIRAINIAEAAVNTAKTGVGNARAALQTAQTNVDQARKGLGDTIVYSPISGYVAERSADVGEFISPSVPNSKIATIVRTSVLRLRIDVPEQNIGQIAIGQGISLQTSAYPDRNFAGTVVRMSPSINATSRVLVVEAEVENTAGLLKPGQFATVRITQGKGKQAVMIPKTAVKAEGDTNKIFVIKDGRATERTVTVGILENDLIEIQNGIQEGESVATSNINVLYDGVQVRQ